VHSWSKAAPVRSQPATVGTSDLAGDAGLRVEDLAALYVLDSISGFGPQKFKQLHDEGLRPRDLIERPSLGSQEGKTWATLRSLLRKVSAATVKTAHERAERQIETAHKLGAQIVSYGHRTYPRHLYESSYPLAILYVRGSAEALRDPLTVAGVGSRGIRKPYDALHADFSRTACASGFTIVSGFALGADSIGHRVARDEGGRTVAVMPSGLDRPFPPENRSLWAELLTYPNAAFVSELAFGTGAASLTLRRRNRLIVALSRGVLVSQSAAAGGAMNSYRFALEQHRPVATFAADGTKDTTGNELIAARTTQERLPLMDQPGATVFPLTSTREDYRGWLRKLSSST
jgi:DNA processing protein